MDYYNFDTLVTSDFTLTAVWNDVVDPNDPTLANLYKALSLGIAEQQYPVATEIPHTDTANKSNPWVIMHYTTMPVAEDNEIVEKYGVILGLKFVDSTVRSWSRTSTNGFYVPTVFQTIFNTFSDEEKSLFAVVQDDYWGENHLFLPTRQNLTLNDAAVWEYYNNRAEFFLRGQYLSKLSNATAPSFGSDRFCARDNNATTFMYCSGLTPPATRTLFGLTLSAATTAGYSKYCVFIPSPLQPTSEESA